MTIIAKVIMKMADEVWVVTALLHKENPRKSDFTIEEILDRAQEEGFELRPGFRTHVLQHAVANRPANPGRTRMLFATDRKRRRLYRNGDLYHPDRSDTKTIPDWADLPSEYRILLDWYSSHFSRRKEASEESDSLLELVGIGRGVWKDEHPDDYIRRLREEK